MVFSQIRTEQAKDALNQARMRGIETHVLREHDDWTTLQFTTHYAKLSFDEMARQMGVNIHGDGPTLQMMDALDAVSEGTNPNKVLNVLFEGGFTRGMVNAYARGPFKYVCASESCGVTVPPYRGRYPQSCPSCGGGLMTAEAWERRRSRRESSKRVRESINEATKFDAQAFKNAGYTKDEVAYLKAYSSKMKSYESPPSVRLDATALKTFDFGGSDSEKFMRELHQKGFKNISGKEFTHGTPSPGVIVGGHYEVKFNSSAH